MRPLQVRCEEEDGGTLEQHDDVKTPASRVTHTHTHTHAHTHCRSGRDCICSKAATRGGNSQHSPCCAWQPDTTPRKSSPTENAYFFARFLTLLSTCTRINLHLTPTHRNTKTPPPPPPQDSNSITHWGRGWGGGSPSIAQAASRSGCGGSCPGTSGGRRRLGGRGCMPWARSRTPWRRRWCHT